MITEPDRPVKYRITDCCTANRGAMQRVEEFNGSTMMCLYTAARANGNQPLLIANL